jgi:hypothetical protein
MKELNIALKEYALMQLFNPFRKYMIWKKEIKRAKEALDYTHSFTHMMIAKYRRVIFYTIYKESFLTNSTAIGCRLRF